MGRKFVTADVFTTRPFGGNPLAVVMEAEDLDAATMQRIAREFNLSETTFVLPPASADDTARVRIFTPARELPFAGHPTVGTAIVLAELSFAPDAPFETEVWLEEEVGVLRVTVTRAAGAPAYAEFAAAQVPAPTLGTLPVGRAAAALSLSPDDIGLPGHAIAASSAGVPFLFVPVRSLDAVRRATPNTAAWPTRNEVGGPTSMFVYARGGESADAAFRARMFGPELGIVEDPATGGAAAAFPGHVHACDPLAHGTHTWLIKQGYEMGRPSDIHVHTDVSSGRITRVRVGGHAVRVSEGTLRV
ncbi:MAG: PhzF family phenazine biosynthesis protein [Armatimonadetes bacterium]|nr:PhzF family phenazine biosynthesis protein [Armatimonadota bacterium]